TAHATGLQQVVQLVHGDAGQRQDVAQGALGEVLAGVDGHADHPSVLVAQEVVTPPDTREGESGFLQGADDLGTGNGGDGWHQATSTVTATSGEKPTSSIKATSASRRSATAASAVEPSPTAPTPGRSWALAHQIPSSSCSRT